MKVGALFAGYGGLEMAVEAHYGAETVWHSEVDPHASKVLAAHWDIPNLGDITAVDWADVEPIDILTGGFPCQDISSAGLGAGIKEGTRSGLWFYMVDAIRHLRPRLVVVENVRALVVRGLGTVVGDLAAVGYDAEWVSVRASDVGAPHRRERVFLTAHPHADGGGREERRHVGTSGEGQDRARHPEVSAVGNPAPPHAEGDEQREPFERLGQRPEPGRGAPSDWGQYAAAIHRWETILGRPAPHPVDDRGRLDPRLVEWMMGLPEGWVCDHLDRRPALRCLGNGVVWQQAAYALELLDGIRCGRTAAKETA